MKTALVTGATRGVGNGVAVSLGQAGFRVFATGRSIDDAPLPKTVIRIPCDHTKDEQTDAVFDRIGEQREGLDLLVNSAWGGYERMIEDGKFTWPLSFWEQPAHRWNSMMNAGVRSAFACSARAATIMVPQRRGLIVNISYWAARKYIGNVVYGITKAATDKMWPTWLMNSATTGLLLYRSTPDWYGRKPYCRRLAPGGWIYPTVRVRSLSVASLQRSPAILIECHELAKC